MSIVTKTGDKGTTALMYGRRVMKCHPRVEAYGAVDELTSAVGTARATATITADGDFLLTIQKDLVVLMGELAVDIQDIQRYVKDGFMLVSAPMAGRLEEKIYGLEAENLKFEDWVIPGATVHSSALDLARSVCRRAERHVSALQRDAQLPNPQSLIYLNRLGDLLWLLARKAELSSKT